MIIEKRAIKGPNATRADPKAKAGVVIVDTVYKEGYYHHRWDLVCVRRSKGSRNPLLCLSRRVKAIMQTQKALTVANDVAVCAGAQDFNK
jgi:hypothetical protein